LEPDLERLLFEFGPPRKAYHPEYPFWRLQNDGVWEVRTIRSFWTSSSIFSSTLIFRRRSTRTSAMRWASAISSPPGRCREIPTSGPPHYLFDRGVFSLSEGLAVTVSERAHGSSGLEEALLRFHSAPIRDPVNPEYRPGEAYLEWHRREVFQGPGRV